MGKWALKQKQNKKQTKSTKFKDKTEANWFKKESCGFFFFFFKAVRKLNDNNFGKLEYVARVIPVT